ncbi:MAG TPA: hypothetical protein ENJ30_07470 [Desulfobulbaceae bacterium]|nr:hypothetical protein [Desulfobulbaceae bacterium]
MAASDSGNRWKAEREAIFLEVLQQTGNVTRATAKAGLARSLVYRRRNMRPDFREKWQNAMEQALDYLEAYLWDKAMGKDVAAQVVSGAQSRVLRNLKNPKGNSPLAQSIRAIKDLGGGVRIFTDRPYARYVEFGTVKQSPRPFLTPAVEGVKVTFRGLI